MENSLIFLPVALQVTLTILLFVYLAVARASAAKQGLVDEERRALHDDAWPDSVIQINNCVRNQFETPVLFYILLVSLWLTDGINLYAHIFAWAFVLSRFVHASIHLRSNYVPVRRKVFIFGGLNIIALMVLLVFAIIAPL